MKKRITEYKNIWGYVKDLFSIKEFRRYTFFEFPNDNPGFFKPYAERIAPKINYDLEYIGDIYSMAGAPYNEQIVNTKL